MRSFVIRRRTHASRSALVEKSGEVAFRGRLALIKIIFVVGGVALISRLVFIQLVQQETYQAMAKMQHISQAQVEAQRGLIYDRDLNLLALNESCISVGADLRMVENRKQCAQKLAPLLGESASMLLARMSGGKDFVWLRRQVDFEVAEKIKALKIKGVRIEKDARRRYPRGELASHVLGHTDIDNRGIAGIELRANSVLNGRPGRQTWQRDALGNRLPDIGAPVVAPEHGHSIVLTIGHVIQTIAAEELRNSMEMFEASGGIVIVSNPATGEILAMDCAPSFDPNRPGAFSLDSRRNRAITDLYEPGSTFKIVTFAGILQEKLRTPEDIIFCENGKMRIYEHEIKDIKSFGKLTVREVLQNSSNIGAIKLANVLGNEKLYQYARDFGFGVESRLNLDGEISGSLKHPVDWSGTTRAAMAMGYEVSVTALQMVMAYGAVANGGLLLEPQIIAGLMDEDGRSQRLVEPKVVRRVISTSVARTLTAMLENVVSKGSGKEASIEGVRIAGKTGTAHKPLTHGLGYAASDYNSSFIGFFPADRPRYVVFVLLENPRTTYWGGMVAAPTFRRITQRLLNLMPHDEDRLPGNSETTVTFEKTIVPDLTNRPRDVAEEILDHVDLEVEWEGDGDFVLNQTPAAGSVVSGGSKLTLNLFYAAKSAPSMRMPGVVGLSLREALRRLSVAGIETRVHGSGRVVRQTPPAGAAIREGARCYIECQSQNAVIKTSMVMQ
jgi:cell division protein FtsI/penicillin-binding protein 2